MTEDLDILVPQEETFTARNGTSFAVRALKGRDLSPFAKALRPLQPMIASLFAGGSMPDAAAMAQVAAGGPAPADVDWIGIIANGGDALLKALAVATRSDAEAVGDLDLDELVVLTQKVFLANALFFTQQVLPAILAAAQAMDTLAAGSTAASS